MLDVRNLRAGFDGTAMLNGVSLHVATGETVAVLGARGAGKTVLARAVSGVLRPWGGQVLVGGTAVSGSGALGALSAGLVHVPAGGAVFRNLSSRDNLLLGATRRARLHRTRTLAFVLEVFPALLPALDRPAAGLDPGVQRMLAIGRGMMAVPRVLVLDDPGLGLPPAALLAVFAAIGRLGEQGLSVMLTAPVTLPPLAIANRAYVLQQGFLLREAPAAELARSLSMPPKGPDPCS